MPPILPFLDPAALEDAFNKLFALLMDLLGISVDLSTLSVVEWLIGEVWGLFPVLALCAFIVIVPLAIFVNKLRLSGAFAIIVLVAGPVIVALWFIFVDFLNKGGDDLTAMLLSIDSAPVSDGSGLNIPTIPVIGPLIDGFVFVGLLINTAWFIQLFMAFEVFNMFIAAAGLFILALYGLGSISRRLFSMLIAAALTTLLLGRAVPLLIMKLGNLAANAIPVDSVGLTGFVTLGGMSTAFFVALALPFLLYKGVTEVLGRGLNVNVGNTVRSRIERQNKINANVTGKVDTRSNRARAVGPSNARHMPTRASETRRAVGTTTNAVLMKVALGASNVHPAAKAVVVTLATAAQAIGNAPAKKPPKERVKPREFYK